MNQNKEKSLRDVIEIQVHYIYTYFNIENNKKCIILFFNLKKSTFYYYSLNNINIELQYFFNSFFFDSSN